MTMLSLENPTFCAYLVAATLMVLKMMGMSWLTVYRMIKVKAGFRSEEDIRLTAMNPHPNPAQLDKNEYVERARRIHQNDIENVPLFLAAGFLFLFTNPSLVMAQVLFYGYVLTRLLHFAAYVSKQSHDLRATCWTPGSLIVLYMAGSTLLAALS